MIVAQIIEELQINNLPHMPNGSFIITDKQREAILSLLFPVESDEELEQWRTEKLFQYCKKNGRLNDLYTVSTESHRLHYLQIAKGIRRLLSQQAVVVAQTDEEAINAYTERRHFNKSETMLVGEGFAVGCLHVRQQLSGKGYANGWEEGFAEGRQQLSKEQQQRVYSEGELLNLLDSYGHYCLGRNKVSQIKDMLLPKEWLNNIPPSTNKESMKELSDKQKALLSTITSHPVKLTDLTKGEKITADSLFRRGLIKYCQVDNHTELHCSTNAIQKPPTHDR